MNFIFSVVVWGEEYVNLFLNAALPCHLAPGNLPAVSSNKSTASSVYRIYTKRSDAQTISNHSAYAKLISTISVEFIYIDELLQDHHAKTCVICNSDVLEYAGRTNNHVIFLTPDTLFSNGSFNHLVNLAALGKSTVLIGWFRVSKEPLLQDIIQLKNDDIINAASRSMVALALRHRHSVTDTWFWDSKNFIRFWPSKLLWRVDENNLLERSFHLLPLMVKPQNPEERLVSHTHPGLQIDGNDYLSRACPDIEQIKIVDDSDDLFCIDLLSEQIRDTAEFCSDRSNVLELALWAKQWTWESQRNNFRVKIRHHVNDIKSAEWGKAEAECDDIATSFFVLFDNINQSTLYATIYSNIVDAYRHEMSEKIQLLAENSSVALNNLENEKTHTTVSSKFFLIVVPRFVNYTGQYYIFPLGLAYISAALKKAGYSVVGLNLNHSDESVADQIAVAINRYRPQVVCTGGLSIHYSKIKDVVDATRKINPDLTIVVGGGLVSSEPELMLKTLNADFGVIGEGERTIVELADELTGNGNFAQVNGIVFEAASGELCRTAARDPIINLDDIPYPDYEAFDYGTYLGSILPNDERDISVYDSPRPVYVVSSRSCPYSCTFCYHPLGKKYRARSLDNFFDELQHWISNYQANIFYIMDELFSVNEKKITEFCARIKKLNVRWAVQLTVRNINADMLNMMRDAGCYEISYGLESGSDEILKSMKKPITVEQSLKALELTYNAGIGLQGNFLFGDSAETVESAYQTFVFWLQSRKHQIYMIPVEVYPGTELYQRAVTAGKITDKLDYIISDCPTLNLTGMTDRQYLQVLLLAYILRETYLHVPATVKSCREDIIHPLRGQLYTLEITCPHCNQTALYRNMAEHGHHKFGCRHCYRRLDIPPFSNYSYWPLKFRLAAAYNFQPSHCTEIRNFLDIHEKSWLIAENIKIEGTACNYNIVRLFGLNYLIPENLTIDDIRRYRLQLYLVDLDNSSIVSLSQ